MLKDCPRKGKCLTHFHYSLLKDDAVPPADSNFAMPIMGSLCTVRVSKHSDISSAVRALQRNHLTMLLILSANCAAACKHHRDAEHQAVCVGTSLDTAALWNKGAARLCGPTCISSTTSELAALKILFSNNFSFTLWKEWRGKDQKSPGIAPCKH